MKTLLLIWVTLMSIIPTIDAGIISDEAKVRQKCQAQIDSAIVYMTHRRYKELALIGGKIESIGKKNNDRTTENLGKALRLRGLVNSYSDIETSRDAVALSNIQRSILTDINSEKLDSLTIASLKPETRELLAYVNLALASFCLNSDMDYSLAMEYAGNARLLGHTIPMPMIEAEALGQLSSLMLINHDSESKKISEEGLAIARKSGDVSTVFTLLANLANLSFEAGKPIEALSYLKEAEKVVETNGMHNERNYIYTFYGDIYSQLGRSTKAEKEYLKAVNSPYKENIYNYGYALYSYGAFLQRQNRHTEALKVYRAAKAEATNRRSFNYDGYVLQGIVNSEEALGHYREALHKHRAIIPLLWLT